MLSLRVVSLLLALTLCNQVSAQSSLLIGSEMSSSSSDSESCNWPRGGKRCCGTLNTPGASHGGRRDETDHCFPASASDHFVCCVDIKSVDNEVNQDDPTVATFNPLSGPIKRNSNSSSYSWCVCSQSICTRQLKGRVAWVGQDSDL